MRADMSIDEKGLSSSIPEEWLKQLREVLKQDNKKAFVVTVLSSSVIAALLSVIANFGLESYKAHLSASIEEQKADYQLKNDQLKEKRQMYAKLTSDFRQFEVDLKTCSIACKLAMKNRTNISLVDLALHQCDVLSDQMKEVTNAKTDPLIDEAIVDRIDRILDPLGFKLSIAMQDSGKISELVSLLDQTQQSLAEVKKQILVAARSKDL